MKRLFCPRCQEVFEQRDHFCHKCGLRKGKPFSRKQWWSIALLTNLLIVLLCAVLREKVVTAEGYPLDLTTETAWLLFGLLGLCTFLPTICIYRIYRVLWLRKHGVVSSGEVVGSRQYYSRRGRRFEVSVVEFTLDRAQLSVCQVEHWDWWGLLPPHEKVKVLYDPYNPNSCAQVGSGLGDLIYTALLGLPCVGLFILITVFVIGASPG